MGKAWDINEETADQDEQQDMSESGGVPADEAEDDEKTDDRGLNRSASDSNSETEK